MKEIKVYVDELPKSCWDCFCQDNENGRCKILEKYTDYVPKDCPLIDIKDHDKELVAKVLEEVENAFTEYLPLRNRTGAWFYGRLNEIENYNKEQAYKDIEIIADFIIDLQTQLDQQKAMWNELKEWVEEIKLWNEKQMKEARLNLDYYIRAKSQNVFINKMLDKMQELEGEKDVKD